jgi:hypothetical protein
LVYAGDLLQQRLNLSKAAEPFLDLLLQVGGNRDLPYPAVSGLTERIEIGPWPLPLPFSQKRQPDLLQRIIRLMSEPARAVLGSGICLAKRFRSRMSSSSLSFTIHMKDTMFCAKLSIEK